MRFYLRGLLIAAAAAPILAQAPTESPVEEVDEDPIVLRPTSVTVVEKDLLGFPIVDHVEKACRGTSGSTSTVKCSPLACELEGTSCVKGPYVSPCCLGNEAAGSCALDTCGKECTPAGESCTVLREDCTKPSCYSCTNEFAVEEKSNRVNYDCFETGIVKQEDGTEFEWAVGCGVIDEVYACQAWRTGDGLSHDVDGLISVIYPCDDIASGECGGSSATGERRRLEEEEESEEPTANESTDAPSSMPSSSPSACPFDCSANMCKAFDGINWFLGDNFMGESLFAPPAEASDIKVEISAPRFIIGDQAVPKWTDLVTTNGLCDLEREMRKCAEDSKNHGRFMICLIKVLKNFEDSKTLRKQDTQVIINNAGQSNILDGPSDPSEWEGALIEAEEDEEDEPEPEPEPEPTEEEEQEKNKNGGNNNKNKSNGGGNNDKKKSGGNNNKNKNQSGGNKKKKKNKRLRH